MDQKEEKRAPRLNSPSMVQVDRQGVHDRPEGGEVDVKPQTEGSGQGSSAAALQGTMSPNERHAREIISDKDMLGELE